jgi:membrane protein
MKRTIISSLRVLSITVKKYGSDRCALWSSALTFFTLMSIVPVAAVAFAVAKGFGFQEMLKRRLMEDLADHQEGVGYGMEVSHRLLERPRGGSLAGVGSIVLLLSVIKVLDNIEQSFNNIWGVTHKRPFGRKIADYLAIMLIAPVLLITSGSATVMIMTQMQAITESLGPGVLTPIITAPIKLIPLSLIWILLSFMYVFIPNTRVNVSSGLVAGLAAGAVFVIAQKIYISFQVGVAHYNAVYGSFAALPLFLVWLQLCWLIVLAGAELSYAYQNAHACGIGLDMHKMSPAGKKLISLTIARYVVAEFAAGSSPSSDSGISGLSGLPLELVRAVLHELCEAGVLVRVELPPDGEYAYMPAKDPDRITVFSVIEALEGLGELRNAMPLPGAPEDLQGVLREFCRIVEDLPGQQAAEGHPLSRFTRVMHRLGF